MRTVVCLNTSWSDSQEAFFLVLLVGVLKCDFPEIITACTWRNAESVSMYILFFSFFYFLSFATVPEKSMQHMLWCSKIVCYEMRRVDLVFLKITFQPVHISPRSHTPCSWRRSGVFDFPLKFLILSTGVVRQLHHEIPGASCKAVARNRKY